MRLFNQNTGKFKISGSVIVCDGNSLTYGYLSTNPSTKSYPALLAADSAFSSATIYNKGVNAQTTLDMISDATSDIDPNRGSGVNILIAWEVGNDIYYNGSASGAVTNFWNYCDARRAKGWKVYVLNCPPRSQTTSFGDNPTAYQTKLTTANGLIASGWRSHADGFIDVASDSRFSGYSPTYYNADNVHYTDAGYQVIKDLVKSALI